MRRTAALLIAAMFLLPSALRLAHGEDKLTTLAARGSIDLHAPVHAASQIVIHAPPEKVWRILTTINEWPRWQSTVSEAQIDGALAPGTSFTWKNGGSRITSRIARLVPGQEIGWTGVAYGAHAIHLWLLKPQPDGSTLVETQESMKGFLLSAFYSSKDLAESHRVWLDALKREAEK